MHLTRKIVSEMTYNVGWDVKPYCTIPHTCPHYSQKLKILHWLSWKCL